MTLHGVWNGLSLFGAAGLAAGYLIMSCVLVALIVILVADRRRVIGLIRRYLPAYQHTGLVTADDVAMLASLPARGVARRWAWGSGGHPAATAMSDYQLAATELALACAKADRGALGRTAFAAREHALLTLMALARSAFNHHVPGGTEVTPAPWAASASALTHGHHHPGGVTGHLPGRPAGGRRGVIEWARDNRTAAKETRTTWPRRRQRRSA